MEIKTAQKDVIAFEAMFPHDTQLALLSLAQRRLAAAFSRHAPESALPFSFMTPFCPDSPPVAENGQSRLTVGPAAIREGWIVAPIAVSPIMASPSAASPVAGKAAKNRDMTEIENVSTAKFSARLPDIPGYPALPRGSAFILGYAGSLAEAILAEAVAEERAQAGSGGQGVLTATVSVRARYRATVEIAIARDERFFSASYAIGPAHWER